MTRQTTTQMQQKASTTSTLSRSNILQRKCESCGQHTIAGGECAECGKKKNRLQRKLTIGDSNDPLEREADRVADQVMAAPSNSITSGIRPRIQRYTGQRVEGMNTAPSSVNNVLSSSGKPLDRELQQDMEQRFGHDFSHVRVHTNTEAERSAREVRANAYTVGHNIVFGAGQFTPGTHEGRRLIAHELTHVVQQSGTHEICADQVKDKGNLLSISTQLTNRNTSEWLARQEGNPVCEKGHPLGANVQPPKQDGSSTIVYQIWGTWHNGDTDTSFMERSFRAWIAWRFGLKSGKEFDAVLDYMKRYTVGASGGGKAPAPHGCQVPITLDQPAYRDVQKLSGESARAKAAAKKKKAEEEAAKKVQDETAHGDPSGNELGTGNGQPTDKKVEGDKAGTPLGSSTDNKDGKPKDGQGNIGDFGFLKDAAKQATDLDKMPSELIKSDIGVLKDPALADKYLQIQEHYTGRSISPSDRTAVSDGLDAKEIESIEDGKPMRRALTALFTQGWQEFVAAGGSDIGKFSLLEQIICEQFTRGNPTATHNQLKIGKGVPENTLGIVDRHTNILLYNDSGIALLGIGGVGFRDKGYIASRVKEGDDKWLLNIANVKDPGLRILLNSLRQTFGDPTRMAFGGAQMYFKHIEAVNKKVLAGLSKEVVQKFEDMLPYFVGFLAGHAVATFLMRVPNPYVAGVGLALKGLLVGAGYIMEIDFGVGALDRLMLAAAFLNKFEENDKHELSELSQDNLNAAAKIIQDMVAEIAAMFATAALGKLVSRAHAGKERFKVECTHCDLDGPGAPEVKMETKKAETKEGETGKIEPGKTVETPKTEKDPGKAAGTSPNRRSAVRDQAKKRLEQLQNEQIQTQAEIVRLERELYAARAKVNRLKEKVNNSPTGSEARTKALEEFKAAQRELDSLLEEDELGGYQQEKLTQIESEKAILDSLKLQRPSLWQSTKDAIKKTAKKNADGKFLDANTGEVIEGEPVYGHKYGRENRRLILEASEKGMTQEEFTKWVNEHPEWFQLETKANNESHKFEKPGID